MHPTNHNEVISITDFSPCKKPFLKYTCICNHKKKLKEYTCHPNFVISDFLFGHLVIGHHDGVRVLVGVVRALMT